MAVLTTAQEYEKVREAIQSLYSTGALPPDFTLGDMTISGNASAQISQLEKREATLAARLTQRNVRKRTRPDFS